jgi:hypothetical protein
MQMTGCTQKIGRDNNAVQNNFSKNENKTGFVSVFLAIARVGLTGNGPHGYQGPVRSEHQK